MVRIVYFCLYARGKTAPDGIVVENVVYTDGKSMLLEGESDTVSALTEGTMQSASQHAVSVGNRGVVEVAADYDGVVPIPLHQGADAVSLPSAVGGGLGKQVYYGFMSFRALSLLGFSIACR